MVNTKVNVYGVRGSAPISHKDYMKYGGNTASFTVRTPENTLIFLDAGTGIKLAEEQLEDKAKRVYLLISHTHADHIIGFGMSKLSKLDFQENYKDTGLKIIGPKGIEGALSKFYDGEIIWPVKFGNQPDSSYFMKGIDYENIVEYERDNQEVEIDQSTKVFLLKGNHPVQSSVILYRINMDNSGKQVSVVYATDNEFDFIESGKPNPEADELKQKYVEFIKSADLLIAEAQYSKEGYSEMKGYGHSYPEQIIELGAKAGVQKILITHHNLDTDDQITENEQKAIQFASSISKDMKVEYAKEGTEINFGLQ